MANSSNAKLPDADFRANVAIQAQLNNMPHGCPILAVHFASQTTVHAWYGGGTVTDRLAVGRRWKAKARISVQGGLLKFVTGMRTYLPGSVVYHGDLKVRGEVERGRRGWGRGAGGLRGDL